LRLRQRQSKSRHFQELTLHASNYIVERLLLG
jgi:hypothetical protein